MFQKILAGVFLAFACWNSASGQQYIVTTIAGNGAAGFSGDGGAANSAQLNLPGGIALDASGNLYIADGGNHRVRKLSNGTITTVAGTGTAGYAGDNGPAASAQLSDPVGVAVDSSGNLYIADAGNAVIRKVSNGTITTIAGNNKSGPGNSGDGGAAANGQLNHPAGVALDSAGNLFIADAANNAIREVSGGNLSSLPLGTLQHPNSIAIDPSGNLYIADTNGRRIIFWSHGTLTGFAGTGTPGFSGDNGPAVAASLYDPVGVARDSSGNIYIADTFNNRIRKVSPDGIITTIAGNGSLGHSGDGNPATSAALFFPHGIAVDSMGNVYFSDEGSHTVRLLQIAAPVTSSNSIVNAASFLPQVSPGALATIFAAHVTGQAASATVLPLPSTLGGVSVSVNGVKVPLLYVNPTQVNFQVPWETSVGAATVAISAGGLTSDSVKVPVVTAAPGLFSYGAGRAVVQNSDFSLNTASNPAKAGSTIMVYVTGSGPVNPPVNDGAPTPSGTLVDAPPATATIGSAAAQVSFSGLAPGFVGLGQMNIVVPGGLAQGDYPLTVTVSGQASNSATVSVSP